MAKTRRFFSALVAGGLLLGLSTFLSITPALGQRKVQPVRPFQVQPQGRPVQFQVQPVPPGGGVLPGQPLPPGQPQQPTTMDSSSQFGAIQLHEKSEFRQYIEVASDCIEDKNWKDASIALQSILNEAEDFYVKVEDKRPRGRSTYRWTSVKYEANNLLGTMPREGLAVYEQMYGGRARFLLEQAKKTGDMELLARVAQQFLHTEAGPAANELLATYFLDRGQFFQSALRFERILNLPEDRHKTNDLTLLKAALAYRRAGDGERTDAIWQRLIPRLRRSGGLRLGERYVSASQLQNLLDNLPEPKTLNPDDWSLIHGDATNSAQAPNGSAPLLDEIAWDRKTILDKNEYTGLTDLGSEAKAQIDAALARIRQIPSAPVMSGFFPIAVDGKLIYRDYRGITALALRSEKGDDGEIIIKPGGLEWKSTRFEGSLAIALNNSRIRSTLTTWLSNFQNAGGFQSLPFENSLVGTLSSDRERVYAVDDLAVPVPPQYSRGLLGGRIYNQAIPKSVKDKLLNNVLYAYNIKTGKIAWRRGGVDPKTKQVDPKFEESLFLGPPLPVGGKMFVLNERKDGELRLVSLDPANGSVVSMQTLGTVEQYARAVLDPARRINAVHMAYGEGMLVCPTNAGQVLGVDLMSRTLAWAYPYREKRPQGQQNPGQPFIQPGGILPLTPATWKSSPPVIHKGKVVFSAPDAHSLHCVNLKDGTMAWKRRKSRSDLYLAGVWNGKVIVVGKNSCSALRISDGAAIWTVTTGHVPSGQGVASNNIYYLPLSNGEICAIDIERGIVKAHNRPRSDTAPRPGNLVFYEGVVLSQTPDKIIAYPQLSAKLQLVRRELAKNPADLAKRTLLGELLLAGGKVHDAVSVLRKVRASNPPKALQAQVRKRLYEALTDLFQVDFKVASVKYMDEYKELLKVGGNDDLEEQRRKGKFLRILGRGREGEGNLVAAFAAYRDLGSLELYQTGGVPARDDPARKIPVQVWLRARISSMFAKAPVNQKKPLELKISRDWQKIRQSKDIGQIRSFVAMFDTPFQVGREARLHLAHAIINKGDRSSYLEAELNLEQLLSEGLKHTTEGGQALEALAQLEIQKRTAGSMKTAAEYYRQLALRFPNTVIRDGKNGARLYKDLETDKRFLPYLGRVRATWGSAPIKTRELPAGSINASLFGFILRPKGDLTPATRDLRIVLDIVNTSTPKLKLVDMTTGKQRWSLNLKISGSNYNFLNYFRNYVLRQAQNNANYYPNGSFRFFHAKGHLAVVQVVSEVYGIDLENPRVLWHHNLLDWNKMIAQRVSVQQMLPDGQGNLSLMLYNQNSRQRYRVQLGHVGTAQASYVCLLKGNNIVMLDPLTGKTMWTKQDVSDNVTIFGDGQHLFLVDGAAGKVLKASDGTPVEIRDFSFEYQNRLRLLGHRILTAAPVGSKQVVRLYDIPTGKDVWKKEFAPGVVMLHSEDADHVGAIDPATGRLTIVSAKNGKDVLQTNIVKQPMEHRINLQDLRNLQKPLLLADADNFYVALNQPIDAQQVVGSVLANNFANGLRGATVNGWFCAFHRKDGSAVIDGEKLVWKKGEMAWHSSKPVTNQLLVLEQFPQLPVVLFTARYNQGVKGARPGIVGTRWISNTQSIDKRTGKWIHCPIDPRANNGNPRFQTFSVDARDGTINMIGYTGILQHYVDDGRPRAKQASNTGGKTGSFPVSRPPAPVEIRGRIRGGLQPLPVNGAPPAIFRPINRPQFQLPQIAPNARQQIQLRREGFVPPAKK